MTPGTRDMDPAGLPTSLGEAVSSLVTQHLTPTQEIPTCVFLRDTDSGEGGEGGGGVCPLGSRATAPEGVQD